MDVRFPDIANWPDIVDLVRQLDNAKCDAEELVSGLSEELGTWTPSSCAWSVAECLDHIAIANSAYLNAMLEPAERAPARPHAARPCEARTLRCLVRSHAGAADQADHAEESSAQHHTPPGPASR